jgi:hypothetical protein
MKKRFTFKCWNEKCKRTYTLFKEITKEQELIVACPFCQTEGVVKLELFRKTPVLRGDDEQFIGFYYDFPEVIPTQNSE